jgi:hypothetical protein
MTTSEQGAIKIMGMFDLTQTLVTREAKDPSTVSPSSITTVRVARASC